MAFFRNRAVNLLNLHYAIHALALHGGGAFYFVYFLKSGFSPETILIFFAASLAGRFFLRPLIIPLAVRWGVRRLLILGTLLVAVQYPLLAEVTTVGPTLMALCAISAIGDTVYWTTYHTYFATLGDDEHRGHQVSVREAISAVIGIASPLIAGLVLVNFGPRAAFGITAAVQALAALPLMRTPEVAVAREAPGTVSAARGAILLFMADGWIAVGYLVIWQLGLFLSLGESYVAYGSALAVAAFVGALAGLVLGRHIDAGHGARAVWLAMGVFGFVIALRAAALGHPTLAVAANALGAFVSCLYTPTLMTAVYTQCKRSPCPLRFQVATEGSWDIGGATASLICALMLSRGVPLYAGILVALAGAGASLVFLRRYYAGEAARSVRAAPPLQTNS